MARSRRAGQPPRWPPLAPPTGWVERALGRQRLVAPIIRSIYHSPPGQEIGAREVFCEGRTGGINDANRILMRLLVLPRH